MIDLTKILNEGDTIFCSFTGLNCKIVQIFNDAIYPIYIQDCEQNSTFATVVTKEGKFANRENAECVIWPDKNTRTWKNYQKYNLGDIVVTKFGTIAIIDKFTGDTYYNSTVALQNNDFIDTNVIINPIRLATKEECKRLYKALENNNHYWNSDTKQLTEFKTFLPGDIVYLYNSNSIAVIKEKEYNDYYRSFFVYRPNSKTFLTNQLVGPSRKATKEEIQEMRDEMDKQGIYFDYVTCKFEKLLKPEDSTFVNVINPKSVYWFVVPKDLDHQRMLMNKLKSLSKVSIKIIDFKDKPSYIGRIIFNFNDKIQSIDSNSEIAKVIMMFGKELKINL